ncbi:hypothetical protein ACFQ1E_13190 [Sphingomonas canadensis]|uniref:Uncharacterized protein n=1 Tax=Sphingomonas canadensis TaxID=1219257 RepID=A0ABW3HAV5_9SPHN|nr:hypothetical protein [Sphingomonas canadensis]MCW3837047.1 hypothetical protein [Sphingomonas canadensis]
MSGRGAAGAVAAAIVAPAVIGLMIAASVPHPLGFGDQWWRWMALAVLFGSPVAMLHLLLLALPAYLLLRQRWRIRWWSAALAGAIIAVMPAAVISLVPDALSASSLAEFIGRAYWSVQPLPALGLAGIAGGLVFWSFVRERREDFAA